MTERVGTLVNISNNENLNGEWDNLITCIPISYHKSDKRYKSEVILKDASNLNCKALCKEIHTIDRNRFVEKTFSVREGQMKFIEKILSFQLLSFYNIKDLENQITELKEQIESLKTTGNNTSKSKRGHYRKWTVEKVDEFLHDAAMMSIDACSFKYKLSRRQFLSTRRYCMMKRNSSRKYNK